MAVALNNSSSSQNSKGSTMSMDSSSSSSSPLQSPNSDKCFWSSLCNRVDTILEDRKRKGTSAGIGEQECGKQFKEDSLLLLRGFDSIASSLSQLTSNLDVALQGASNLAKQPPLAADLLHKEPEKPAGEDEIQPKTKRKCSSRESSHNHEVAVEKENNKSPNSIAKGEKMEKARNLAVSMASKATSLARELKSIKSELCFMQERCALLEEENRRLRDGLTKGARLHDEDDLVRLQLEALLAEKSRLANENANLTRENQCLHQLVEYHQLTSQDLSASYEQAIQGMYLDFLSPLAENPDDNPDDDIEAPQTPRTNLFGFSSSIDEYPEEEEGQKF